MRACICWSTRHRKWSPNRLHCMRTSETHALLLRSSLKLIALQRCCVSLGRFPQKMRRTIYSTCIITAEALEASSSSLSSCLSIVASFSAWPVREYAELLDCEARNTGCCRKWESTLSTGKGLHPQQTSSSTSARMWQRLCHENATYVSG